MEIIIAGAVVFLITGAFKWLASKIQNKDVARSIILVVGALLALGSALIYQHVPQEIILSWVKTWGVAIGFYEVVYKTVVKPSLEKAGLL